MDWCDWIQVGFLTSMARVWRTYEDFAFSFQTEFWTQNWLLWYLLLILLREKTFFMPLPNHPHTPQRSHVSPLSEATLFKFKLNKARWNKKLLWYVMPLLISPVGQTNSFPFVEHPAWDKPYITTVLLIQGCHSQSACCLLYQSGSNTKDLSLHCHRHH